MKRGQDRPGRVCACGDHAFAPLTRGFMTIVSPEDIGVFAQKWGVNFHRGHAAAMRIPWPERTSQLLHRLLVDAPGGMSVDHINGDSLDNRRHNLRICDQAQNSWNSRAHRDHDLPKGVSKKRSKFTARICVRGVTHRLGTYETIEAAARAYAEAAERLCGEYARAA